MSLTTGMEFPDVILQRFPKSIINYVNKKPLMLMNEMCALSASVWQLHVWSACICMFQSVSQPLGILSLVLLPIVPLGRGSTIAHTYPLHNPLLAHL